MTYDPDVTREPMAARHKVRKMKSKRKAERPVWRSK